MQSEDAKTPKRALVVSYVYPPMRAGGSIRLGESMRYLAETGWEADVLCGEAPGESTDPQGIRRMPLAGTDIGGYRRGAATPVYGSSALAYRLLRGVGSWFVFPDRQLFWMLQAVFKGRKLVAETKPDVIFASCPPMSSGLAAYWIAKASGVPLVLDYRDLWATSPLALFSSVAHRALARRIESKLLHYAQAVTCVSLAMGEHLSQFYDLEMNKVHCVTNGFCPEHFSLAQDRRSESDKKFRLVYTGSVHRFYDFDPVWEALSALQAQALISTDNFVLDFVGNLHVDTLKHWGIDGLVRVHDLVSHEEVFEYLARADAFLLLEIEDYVKNFGHASKVFDYILCGKPIVAVVDEGSPTEELLTDVDLGHFARFGRADQLANCLRDLIEAGKRPAAKVDITGQPYAAFNRRMLASKLSHILVEAAKARGA